MSAGAGGATPKHRVLTRSQAREMDQETKLKSEAAGEGMGNLTGGEDDLNLTAESLDDDYEPPLEVPRGELAKFGQALQELQGQMKMMEAESRRKDEEMARMRRQIHTTGRVPAPMGRGATMSMALGTPSSAAQNSDPASLHQTRPRRTRTLQAQPTTPAHDQTRFSLDSPTMSDGQRVMPRIKTRADMKYSGSVSFNQYLKKFSLVARCNHWTEEEKFGNLIQNLEGDAEAEAVDSGVSTYEELCDVLNEAFEEKTFGRLLLALATRKQQENETVDEFCRALKRIAQKVYKGQPTSARDIGVSTHFVVGLRDPRMMRKVAESGAENLAGFYKAAKLVEAGQEIAPGPKSRKPTDKAAKSRAVETCEAISPAAMPAEVEQLKAEVEKLKMQMSSKKGPNQGGKGRGKGKKPTVDPASYRCYWCGQPGHITRECPVRLAGQQPLVQPVPQPQGNSQGPAWRGAVPVPPSPAPTPL